MQAERYRDAARRVFDYIETLGLNVDSIEDSVLYGATGERVGEVDEVLIGPAGTSMAVSLDIGGYLDIGSKHVLISIDDITNAADGVRVELTRDELEALPDHDG